MCRVEDTAGPLELIHSLGFDVDFYDATVWSCRVQECRLKGQHWKLKHIVRSHHTVCQCARTCTDREPDFVSNLYGIGDATGGSSGITSIHSTPRGEEKKLNWKENEYDGCKWGWGGKLGEGKDVGWQCWRLVWLNFHVICSVPWSSYPSYTEVLLHLHPQVDSYTQIRPTKTVDERSLYGRQSIL